MEIIIIIIMITKTVKLGIKMNTKKFFLLLEKKLQSFNEIKLFSDVSMQFLFQKKKIGKIDTCDIYSIRKDKL